VEQLPILLLRAIDDLFDSQLERKRERDREIERKRR
jgi:hypothetical protein